MRYVYTISFSTWDGDIVKDISVDLEDYYDEDELDNTPDCELVEKAEELAWDVANEEGYDVADIVSIEQEE